MTKPSVPAGSLDRVITLQSYIVAGQDELGAETMTWSDVATVPAGKRDMTRDEIFRAGGVVAEATVAFRIRWRDDVTTQTRVVYEGETFDVLAVQEAPNTRREALDLIARARPL